MTQPPDADGPTRMPRWFRVLVALAVVLTIGVVILHLTGNMSHMHGMP